MLPSGQNMNYGQFSPNQTVARGFFHLSLVTRPVWYVGFHFLKKILKYMYHSIRHELPKVHDVMKYTCVRKCWHPTKETVTKPQFWDTWFLLYGYNSTNSLLPVNNGHFETPVNIFWQKFICSLCWDNSCNLDFVFY